MAGTRLEKYPDLNLTMPRKEPRQSQRQHHPELSRLSQNCPPLGQNSARCTWDAGKAFSTQVSTHAVASPP